MDDDYWQGQNLAAILSDKMTQIGVACNCHPTFEQFCVIEIGQDVGPIPPQAHQHLHIPGLNLTLEEQDTWPFVNTPPPQEFNMPGTLGCPVNSQHEICGEIDSSTIFPDWYSDLSEDMQDISQNLFTLINEF